HTETDIAEIEYCDRSTEVGHPVLNEWALIDGYASERYGHGGHDQRVGVDDDAARCKVERSERRERQRIQRCREGKWCTRNNAEKRQTARRSSPPHETS